MTVPQQFGNVPPSPNTNTIMVFWLRGIYHVAFLPIKRRFVRMLLGEVSEKMAALTDAERENWNQAQEVKIHSRILRERMRE